MRNPSMMSLYPVLKPTFQLILNWAVVIHLLNAHQAVGRAKVPMQGILIKALAQWLAQNTPKTMKKSSHKMLITIVQGKELPRQ